MTTSQPPTGHHQNQQIPQQWGPPPTYLQQPMYAPPQPKNGFGTTALVLGIVGTVFAVIPLIGVVAWPMVIVGLVLGILGILRARAGVATNKGVAISGTVLSAVGLALCILWTTAFAATVANTPTPTAGAAATVPAVSSDVSSPFTPTPGHYQLEVTGTAKKVYISYGVGTSTSAGTGTQGLPWRKTVETTGEMDFATVTVTTVGPGDVTCTITNTDSRKVEATQTAKSLDDSQYGSATASCSTVG